MPPHAEKILWGERKNSVSVKGLVRVPFSSGVHLNFFLKQIYKANKENRLVYQKTYYENNKQKILEHQRSYNNKKKLTDDSAECISY